MPEVKFFIPQKKNTTPHEATDKNNEHEMDTAINPMESYLISTISQQLFSLKNSCCSAEGDVT